MIKRTLFAVLGLVAVALFAMPLLPHAGGVLLAYSVTTNSDVSKIWRKSQGKLAQGFEFNTEEFKWVGDLKNLEIDASLREMTFPVDLNEDRGITSLPEGGREAEPMSQNAVDATVSFIHLNGRFTVSKLARWAGAADGGRGEIEKQIKYQGKTKVLAMGRTISDMFYGYSNGYICQTSTNATQSSGTYTLLNAYGDADIAGTTTAQKNFICDKIKVGDKVALIRSAALVANAIGTVTAVTPATPSVAITWAGSVDSDANDYLVFANGASATTIAHTSYSRALVGRLDMLKSTSVHGISSSTEAHWAPQYSSTAGGRFNGVRWRKASDEIRNYGNEDANIVTLMAQGVYRDVMAQYQAAVRFADPFALEIDGDIKGKGTRFKQTRRVPPGMVDMFDSNCLRKKTLLDRPTTGPMWNDGKELIDDSGWIFPIDYALFIATTNRASQAYFTGLDEQ